MAPHLTETTRRTALAVFGALAASVALLVVAWPGSDDARPVARTTPDPEQAVDHEPTSAPSPELVVPTHELLAVRPGQPTDHHFEVAGDFDVVAKWRTGDVDLSLTSPSGKVIDRHTASPDVTRDVGRTYEVFHVRSVEPGTWTATLFGADVAPPGERAQLDIYAAPVTNIAPTARVRQTLSGRTVTLDGSGSTDPDGSIVRYLWEFGDGAVAEGVTASHTYTEPGTYLVTVAVQDDDGRWGVTSAPSKVRID